MSINEITQEERELDVIKVEEALELLMKHFDSVQIFAVREIHSKCMTHVNMGLGNFFSRFGHIKLWIKEQNLTEKLKENEQK